MSICAHESFMSMLMKLSRARAREGVTRTTTIGQYASRSVPKVKVFSTLLCLVQECILYEICVWQLEGDKSMNPAVKDGATVRGEHQDRI